MQALRTEVFSEEAQSESVGLPPHSNTTSLKDKPLPSKAYTKNVLETFPNTYTWRRLLDQTTRASLVAGLQDAKDHFNQLLQLQQSTSVATTDVSEAAYNVLKAALSVAQVDLAQDSASAAFNVLHSVEDAARSLYAADGQVTSNSHKQHLSQFYELLGTEAQFKSLSSFALRCYRHAHSLCGQNFSVQLKLAALYSELEVESAATTIYDRLLSENNNSNANNATSNSATNNEEDDSVSVTSRRSTGSYSSQLLPLGLSLDLPRLRLAWTQLHRAALLVQRQVDGAYLPDAAALAVQALEDYVLTPLGKCSSCFSISIIDSVTVD